MKTLQRIAVIIACSWMSIPVLGTQGVAQIYKWTDAAGTVHFSDTPPPRTAGKTKVEVLPKTEHRPVVSGVPTPPTEEPEAEADERYNQPVDDSADYAPMEPPAEESAPETIIVDDAERDPGVAYRALSPRNRPGQPIRVRRGR